MKTAVYIKKLEGWRGNAALYKLSEPLDGAMHVVVSAVYAMFSGPETYIFKSDEAGNVNEFGELEGSYRGDYSHDAALAGAGYTIVLNDEK